MTALINASSRRSNAGLLGTLALLLSTASAFRDTSPFFLVSSSGSRPQQATDVQFLHAETIGATAGAWLAECPVQNYIFVRQGCVSTEEFDGTQASPNVRRLLENAGEEKRWIVPQVIGAVDVAAMEKEVVSKCGAKRMEVDAESGTITIDDAKTKVYSVGFERHCAHAPEFRSSHLVQNDMFLGTLISKIPKHESFAVIYTTTPDKKGHQVDTQVVQDVYEMDDAFPSAAVHMDLKRDIGSLKAGAHSNSSLPLFETYQYFTPGIFMGLTVSFFLSLLLYVGISAISSLEVSYFAFSKEMGPAAQRKQQ